MYELLYIVPATKTEDEVKKVQGEVTEIINKHASEVVKNDLLGKQKLAYAIKHVKYGYYVLAYFNAEPSALAELDEELRHNTDVLRHMVTKAIEGAHEKAWELAEWEQPDVFKRRRRGPVKKDAPKGPKTEETAKAADALEDTPTPAKEEAPAEDKAATAEALDKKIDAILESDEQQA